MARIHSKQYLQKTIVFQENAIIFESEGYAGNVLKNDISVDNVPLSFQYIYEYHFTLENDGSQIP